MVSSNKYQTNQHVKWNWGNGEGTGQIAERFERSVTRTLQGAEVTRNGDSDDPAYLIKQDSGEQVLKLDSELESQN